MKRFLIGAAVVALLLCGCNMKKENDAATQTDIQQTQSEQIVKTGNTNANISNLGGACYSDGIAYFQDSKDFHMVTSEGKSLTQCPVYFINVLDDYIYYCDGTDSKFDIHRMKKDGSQDEKIIDGQCYYVQVDSNGIYFSNYHDNKKLYRANLDGSDKRALKDVGAAYINLYEDDIYYIDENDDYKIYKTDKNGERTVLISDSSASNLILMDDYAYYINFMHKPDLTKREAVGDNLLYRISLSEDKTECVSSVQMLDVNIIGDKIYYRELHENESDDKICAVDFDGNRNVLAQENGSYLTVAGDNLYYLFRDLDKDIMEIRSVKIGG